MPPEVIDADGHIVERDAGLRAHLAEPFSKRRGSLVPSDGMDTSMGGRPGRDGNNDVPTRLRDMDREGIDVSVLFPDQQLRHDPNHRARLRGGYASAYNDLAAEVCAESPRLRPSRSSRSRTSRRRSARRAAPSSPRTRRRRRRHTGDARTPRLADLLAHLRGARASWRAAVRPQSARGPGRRSAIRQLPVHAHRRTANRDNHPVRRTRLRRRGGAVPELRIGFMECGAGWAPYWMERMDEEWEKRGSVEAPAVQGEAELLRLGPALVLRRRARRGHAACTASTASGRTGSSSPRTTRTGTACSRRSSPRFGRAKTSRSRRKEMILGGNANRFYGWSEA